MENINTQKNFSLVEFYKNNSLVVNFIFLSILFLANCFFAFFSYIALPIAFLMLLCSNTKNGLSYIIFIFPFAWFELAFGMIMLVVCLVTWVIKMLYFKIHKEGTKLELRLKTFIFLGVCVAFCALPISGIYNIHILIKLVFVITIFALVYFMLIFPEEFRLKYNVCILAVALLIASVYAIFRPISEVLSSMIEIYHVNEQIIRFSALFYNPNNLGLVCEIGLCILAYYFVTNKCTKRDVFSFLVFTILGILTFSKTFAIIAVSLTLIFAICALKTKSKIIWITVGLSVCTALAIFIIRPDFLWVYINRISINPSVAGGTSDVVNAITTDRLDLWKGYVKHVIGNPLILFFGKGFGAPRYGLLSPHNLYISVLYQLGIIGIVIFITAITLVAKDAKRRAKETPGKAILLPFAIMAAIALIEDFIFYIA